VHGKQFFWINADQAYLKLVKGDFTNLVLWSKKVKLLNHDCFFLSEGKIFIFIMWIR
jgi:hypothetical protein